jgi:2,2-dialkylglycine decarboxylase (pyruvate)
MRSRSSWRRCTQAGSRSLVSPAVSTACSRGSPRSTSRWHAGYGPLLPGAFALPAPYVYRCPIRHCDGACDCTCLEAGFELVDQQSVGSLCAVIAEPVLSAGGIIVPPDGYFRRLRELCDARGMLLVLDEAQTGFGRLRTVFGFEHDGIVPDLVAVSKTLGGSIPLAATITTLI